MLLLTLSILLLTGSQVQSLSWRYAYDYVVEGGSLTVTANKSATDPSELSYSLIFECPSTCAESLKTLVTVADNAGRGFVIKTTDNTVVEPQFVIVVIVSDKARNIELQRLRFTFIDNDGPEQVSQREDSADPIFFVVKNPPNMPNTIYSLVDVSDQSFRKQWYYEPLQVEFQANEAGTKKIRLHPKEDNTVDGDQRSVIVVKRVSTCEGVQRYYSHQIIKVEDIDVNGQWSEWSDWTKCSNTHAPFCDHTRTRTCQLPPGVLSGNPVCVGGNLEKRDCACKLTFHFQQNNK